MRQLALLMILGASFVAASLHAADFDVVSLTSAVSSRGWRGTIDDRIVRKPTLSPAQSCGSPIACSLVIANAYARCEAQSASAFVARTTLRLFGNIYYYPGQVARFARPVDASVVDGASAVAHEYLWHIVPAMQVVMPILQKLERQRFATRTECERAGTAASDAVAVAFARELTATQMAERTRS